MLFPCHRLSADQVLIEIDDVIDVDGEDLAERSLCAVVSRSGARTVVIDVRTSLVTAAMVNVLLRVRRVAHSRGVALCVLARQPLARKVFRIAGVHRTLLVTATLSGALAVARGCRPPSEPAARRGDGALR
ncbi:hypothetical protein [Streptomyces sp. NPDC006368]|uniref:hypothetical protein n=1 Tax=Streptomyces sp. NPDC006368 TaxID=3156760 RepID=UPI0033A7BD4C